MQRYGVVNPQGVTLIHTKAGVRVRPARSEVKVP